MTGFLGNDFSKKWTVYEERLFLILIFLLHFCTFYSQSQKDRFVFGFAYGTGEELENKDYTYTNSFYKIHFGYEIGKTGHVHFETVFQPEINFGKHQLLNKYFGNPGEPGNEALREKYANCLGKSNRFV